MQIPVGRPVVEVAVASVEPVVAAPVELDSRVLLTGQVVTPMEPSRWSSSSSLAYARAPPGQVRLLELALAPRHRSLVLNPDQA